MLTRGFLIRCALFTSCMLGCAHKPAATPDKPAAEASTPAPATPAPAAAPAPTPAPDPPAAPDPPPPECKEATDCASKGTPAKGMQWACTDSKCAEEKKPAASKKKGKKT